ncbi:MAG: hypothetical protein WC309_02630 [Candidatus Paceibacterota bacterium]|jgi:hypothetical protein
MEIKCNDTSCSQRNSCQRFTEPAVKKQKYFPKSPRWNNECNYYIPNVRDLTAEREALNEEAQELARSMRY